MRDMGRPDPAVPAGHMIWGRQPTRVGRCALPTTTGCPPPAPACPVANARKNREGSLGIPDHEARTAEAGMAAADRVLDGRRPDQGQIPSMKETRSRNGQVPARCIRTTTVVEAGKVIAPVVSVAPTWVPVVPKRVPDRKDVNVGA